MAKFDAATQGTSEAEGRKAFTVGEQPAGRRSAFTGSPAVPGGQVSNGSSVRQADPPVSQVLANAWAQGTGAFAEAEARRVPDHEVPQGAPRSSEANPWPQNWPSSSPEQHNNQAAKPFKLRGQ